MKPNRSGKTKSFEAQDRFTKFYQPKSSNIDQTEQTLAISTEYNHNKWVTVQHTSFR